MLGHNGAGKSTTIKMLTGMIKPSSGNAYVLGKSVVDNVKETSQYVGFCPQHSILYDCLSAREHMQFYGHLKAGVEPVSILSRVFVNSEIYSRLNV